MTWQKVVNLVVVVGAVGWHYRHRVHFWPAWLGLEHVRREESLALSHQISGRNPTQTDFCVLVIVAQGVGGSLPGFQLCDSPGIVPRSLHWAGQASRGNCAHFTVSAFRMWQVSVPIQKLPVALPHYRMGMFAGLCEICWSRGPSPDCQRLWQKNNRNSVADYNCSSVITVINTSIITSHCISYCHFCFQPLHNPNRKRF